MTLPLIKIEENVVNNVDMSSLRAPWQNGPYKNKHTERHKNIYKIMTDLSQPWCNIRTTHQLWIPDICVTWQVDRQTDGQTDNRAKNNTSPHFKGEDIIICLTISGVHLFQSHYLKCFSEDSYLFWKSVVLTFEAFIEVQKA